MPTLLSRSFVVLTFWLCAVWSAAAVPVAYQLPSDGTLPKTYRVTLAIVDAKNPSWIVSQFACGVAKTVTKENGGKFSEEWNGLDDNFMPVPPGDYAVRGIYAPARKWEIDGEWHAITPKYFGQINAWGPPIDQPKATEPFGGDPVNSPLRDVAVGPNGVAVFHYQYLENGLNCPMVDLKKPVGYGQFIRAFNSGGAAGGLAVATDGETVWAFCAEGGPKYVYRPDGKSFGSSPGANRTNGYLPDGWVTAMAAWHDAAANKSYVYVAQRGKIYLKSPRHYAESETEKVDKITVHDGDNGKVLAEIPLYRPLGLAVQGDTLYALHKSDEINSDGSPRKRAANDVISLGKVEDYYVVSAFKINRGIPAATGKQIFSVSAANPADLEVDSHGRIYISDSVANFVYQYQGNHVRVFGSPDGQKPGAYNPNAFIAPAKMATWTDSEGHDRLLVVENGGPNRTSEWSAEGQLLREFPTLQTKANDGYAFDPEHPEFLYLPTHEGWLTRFKIDYDKHTFTTDAVWPNVAADEAHEIKKPVFIRAGGRSYLAGSGSGRASSFNIYQLIGDRWVYSAAIQRTAAAEKGAPAVVTAWHDTNGNGLIDPDEIRPIDLPPAAFAYHGQNWADDFSLTALVLGTPDVWRVTATSFDAKGNPIFEAKKLFSDPVFLARTEGKADAVHGGNELSEKFVSDWAQADGSLAEGFYVQARGGKSFSANEGAQYKVTRYVPDGKGGFGLQWRTGRAALEHVAQEGEMYGGMRVHKPINGLLSVIDQSRCGVLLYTEDGLYVETIFPDGRRFPKGSAGLYPQPGEFFSGVIQPNPTNGKIYFGLGKYTPMLFEADGWSLTENPVKKLTGLPAKVTISAAQIASPPEIALSLRGGSGKASVARFTPALGEVAMDGSLAGWESSEPVTFAEDKNQSAEVRCLYRPEELLLRWHVRLPAKFAARPLPPPERIFSHDQGADTLSFYIQGDTAAKPGGPAEGRPGDVRIVFGLFDNKGQLQPVATGMYPQWKGPGKASPQTYRTPVGTAAFAHVAPLAGARLAQKVDEDGKGFVLVAAIPRSAIPAIAQPFAGGFKTLANFEVTLGGHQKAWWANSDGSASRETYDEPTEARLYPGSWAPIEFTGLGDGVIVRNWLVCGPFGGSGAEKFQHDPPGKMKDEVKKFYEAAAYPPDNGIDLAAKYSGDLVSGYWPPVREVRWKPATIAPLDTRVILGDGSQAYYAATWIYVPAPTQLTFQLQSHQMTFLRWTLNGEPIPVKPLDYKPVDRDRVPEATRAVSLKAGWNQVMLRGYCYGYAPFRAGLVVKAPEATLWKLQLSATPPK